MALHSAGVPPIALGLEFRRQLLVSLHALARLTGAGGRLSDVRAFEVTTIFFHRWLSRLGFQADRDGLAWPGLVAAYQRALRAYLRPASPIRHGRATGRRAQRLWISHEALLARHGADGEDTNHPGTDSAQLAASGRDSGGDNREVEPHSANGPLTTGH